jgi:Protein of unknown function (DUF4238)
VPRDHLVPQFYLKNFQIDTKPGWIYSYIRGYQPIAKAIRAVAYEGGYYEIKVPPSGVPSNSVDRLLQRTETTASPIIDQLLKEPISSLSDDQKMELSGFMALLSQRTRFAREGFVNIFEALSEKAYKNYISNDERFLQLAREAGQDNPPEELLKSRDLYLDGQITGELVRGGETEDYFLKLELEVAETVMDCLYAKHWHLIETDSSRVFLTSDHPIVLLPSPHHRPPMSVGYRNGHIMLPLSPTRALLLTNEPLSKEMIKVGRDKMREYQRYTITRSYKSVFSNIFSKGFQRILESMKQGEIIKAYVE